jgi:hypothetical protein
MLQLYTRFFYERDKETEREREKPTPPGSLEGYFKLENVLDQ